MQGAGATISDADGNNNPGSLIPSRRGASMKTLMSVEVGGEAWVLSLLERILEAAKRVYTILNGAPEKTKPFGGYYCHVDSGGVIMVARMGCADPQVIGEAEAKCCLGLDGKPHRDDFRNRLWRGFVGLPDPLLDDAVIYVLLTRLGKHFDGRSEEEVLAAVSEGRNRYLRPLLMARAWDD